MYISVYLLTFSKSSASQFLRAPLLLLFPSSRQNRVGRRGDEHHCARCLLAVAMGWNSRVWWETLMEPEVDRGRPPSMYFTQPRPHLPKQKWKARGGAFFLPHNFLSPIFLIHRRYFYCGSRQRRHCISKRNLHSTLFKFWPFPITCQNMHWCELSDYPHCLRLSITVIMLSFQNMHTFLILLALCVIFVPYD